MRLLRCVRPSSLFLLLSCHGVGPGGGVLGDWGPANMGLRVICLVADGFWCVCAEGYAGAVGGEVAREADGWGGGRGRRRGRHHRY